MILGISGLSGAGKDTVADFLVKDWKFVRVSLADPLKRIAREVFAFTEEQLWGPSEERNKPDKRYPRGTFLYGVSEPKLVKLVDGALPPPSLEGFDEAMKNMKPMTEYLTPRYALQQLGTQWGRDCYDNVWIDYALRIHDSLQKNDCYYDQMSGLRPMSSVSDEMTNKNNVVIPDVRFKNEMNAIREAGGKVIRIKRPGKETPEWNHASETEQLSVPDEWFDHILINDGEIADLGPNILSMIAKWREQ